MDKPKYIRCAGCVFTRQDKNASIYSQKRCKDCEMNAGCTCRKKDCACGKGCKYRKTDEICPKQTLKWAAIECGCSDSEYYRALLNITLSGEPQDHVTWSGCAFGERRDD